jgi:fructose-bisphosphate aldolase class II
MIVSLKEVLSDAQKNGYAVGLFNTTDTDMVEGAIAAAEELRSPIIIGTAEVLLPYGELQLIGPAMVNMAKNATVPVVVHYDHGLTFERCIEAMDLGFSSIMFDGSAGEESENLANTRKMVEIAHSRGVSVEGEIGHVGNAETGESEDDDAPTPDMYTTPQQAVNFVKETGVDALAVAIGTAQGAYKTKPQLDINRLKEIRASLDTPLVLHGGSGLSDDDFRNTIKEGIAKVNIFTDLCEAGKRACAENLDLSYLEMRNKKVEAIKEEVKKKMMLFGCNGKA